jgi:hypothetical protein
LIDDMSSYAVFHSAQSHLASVVVNNVVETIREVLSTDGFQAEKVEVQQFIEHSAPLRNAFARYSATSEKHLEFSLRSCHFKFGRCRSSFLDCRSKNENSWLQATRVNNATPQRRSDLLQGHRTGSLKKHQHPGSMRSTTSP